jgi:hypothetical protein
MDDYVLLLCLEPEALDAFCSNARVSHRPTAPELCRLIGDVGGLLRAKGVTIDSSKRYLDLVRGIVGF